MLPEFFYNPNKKYKILIVDDIPENLQILGNILYEQGMEISFATNGLQALETLTYSLPDAILLDISMPEMNGYEVCEHIKQQPETKHIPVIFLTANTETESIVKGFKSGGQDYVTKPFSANELLARLFTHLELKDKTQAIHQFAEQLMESNRKQAELFEKLQLQSRTIAQKNKDLTDGLNYAKIIQLSMLPSLDKVKSFLNQSFVFYLPKDIVSGDFYLIERVNNKIVIVVGDCTGHGVPGAMLTMLGISTLNQMILNENITDPATLLQKLDVEIINLLSSATTNENTNDGMDIAICTIDETTNELVFSGCKRPLFLFRNNELIRYKSSIFSIGASLDSSRKTYHNQIINIENGDTIYLFTDGYTSQFGSINDKKFNISRFVELLHKIHKEPMSYQFDSLEKTLKDWRGSFEQVDDILVIGFKYLSLHVKI